MKSSIALLTTSMITYIYYISRISLVILRTLKILKTLADLKAKLAEPPFPNIKRSNMLRVTIIASNMFILSFKYSITPMPNIFKTMSIVKT